MHLLSTLAPVFLIIAVGAVFRKTKFFSSELVSQLNRIVYWVALPCLLFHEIASSQYDFNTAGKTFAVVFAGMILSILTAYPAAKILKVNSQATGTFVQGAFRGNLMYIGLPIISYSFSSRGSSQSAFNTAVLVLAFIVPIYNAVAVVVLLASQHKIDRYIFIKVARQLVVNPVFIACIVAFLYSIIFSTLPLALERTIGALGQTALPLALLAIGGTLAGEKIATEKIKAFACSLIKCVITPAAGFVFALLLHLTPNETRIALIYLACPAATVTFVMAEQLAGDKAMAATTVLISTAISILSLGAVVALF